MSAEGGHKELEAALIVRSHTPRRVLGHVAALTSVAGYRLQPETPQPIHDTYFDTPQRMLAAQRVALRLRTIGALRLLTLKGPSRRTEWGAAERLELEEPWSAGSLDKMVDALRHAGVTLPRDPDADGSPVDVIRALGLDVVQDRETQRQPRSVIRLDDLGETALAELAVDAVTYHVETNIVRMYEVEVEVKAAGGASAVRAIMERLVAEFAPALQSWPYGKLSTGDIVGRLLREGALGSLLGADDELLPPAIDLIEGALNG